MPVFSGLHANPVAILHQQAEIGTQPHSGRDFSPGCTSVYLLVPGLLADAKGLSRLFESVQDGLQSVFQLPLNKGRQERTSAAAGRRSATHLEGSQTNDSSVIAAHVQIYQEIWVKAALHGPSFLLQTGGELCASTFVAPRHI